MRTLALLLLVPFAAHAQLTGTVTGPKGEKMAGVTVSAKADGSTIRTSVYTDKAGNYAFSPLPAGKYRVSAQALGYQPSKAELDLASSGKQDFRMKANDDEEQTFRQLPGNVALDSLPQASAQDKRMHQLLRNNCTACHTASYPLQFRFDEVGWNAVLELMKNANVYGSYMAKERGPSAVLDYHQKDLAAYLARARGPKPEAKFTLPARPSGEAARVEIREYDMPLDPDANLPANYVQNDGSDWSLATPSVSIPGWGVHDAWLDDAGNVWFTCNIPNKRTSLGKVDTKTGQVKLFNIPAKTGLASQSHGMTRTPDGMIWININPGRGGLARIDPRTEKIDVFIPPEGLSPTGGATTVDYDGKGKIWVSAPDGVLRFDPVTSEWTGYKTQSFKQATGTGISYGAAGDRAGNGYWAVMIHDIIGVADGATGKASEIKLAPLKSQLELATPEAREFYKTAVQPDFNNPPPFAQGPRRMGTDKNADVLWVGNSWGANFARIDTRTKAVTYVDLPGRMQPYHVHVDSKHRPWTNLWGADRVMRYDPATKAWTAFDLPTRGAEPRYISVHEADGKTQVVLPYFRARKIAVMTLR
ncbi:MAG TPA: carboxypeptidase regulatory-like domain-containing protein [Burkholderiales bacterium]|nr:carboxypeptidase regulatory-like domain-containing protein [Burkholderiales bacterium]